jgi:hypothetical protein
MLDRLIEQLKAEIRRAVADLARNPASLDTWLSLMARLLARYLLAAFMVGSGKTEVEDKAQEAIQQAIQDQLQYLSKFGDVLRRDFKKPEDWQDAWASRAESYANSVVPTYWAGKTQGLPLPVMPGELGQCLGNCRCSWRIEKVGKEDYNCYWELGKKDSGNCQTCTVRARKYNPLRIRDGRVLVGNDE